MSKQKKSKKQKNHIKRLKRIAEKKKSVDIKRIENFKKHYGEIDFDYNGNEFSINNGAVSFSANMFDWIESIKKHPLPAATGKECLSCWDINTLICLQLL